MSLKSNLTRGQQPAPSREVERAKAGPAKRIYADVPPAQHKELMRILVEEDLSMRDVMSVLASMYAQDEELRQRVRRQLRV